MGRKNLYEGAQPVRPMVAQSHFEYTDFSEDIVIEGDSIGCTIVLADEAEPGVLSFQLPYSDAPLNYPVLSTGEYQFDLWKILSEDTDGIGRVIVYF